MKILLLIVMGVGGTVQAKGSVQSQLFRTLRPVIDQATLLTSSELAQAVNRFQIRVSFARLNYRRHLHRAVEPSDRLQLHSKWQEWAVATKEELRQLAEHRQHLIDKDILVTLKAIDAELQWIYVIDSDLL